MSALKPLKAPSDSDDDPCGLLLSRFAVPGTEVSTLPPVARIAWISEKQTVMSRPEPIRAWWVGLLLVGLVVATPCVAGDNEVYLGTRWPADLHQPIEQIDYQPWTSLLERYCDTKGRVSYAAWKSDAHDVRKLDQFLTQLSHAGPTLKSSRAARLAFWINAYNAVTIRGILREYPTTSIRNHTARFLGYNIWEDLLLWVGDQTYSLNAMEHDILRKMGEPRIHFAIVCASIGCPRLLNEAYVPDRIDAQLTQSAKAFFADRTKFRYDLQGRRIQLSPILKWFAADFGDTPQQRMEWIAPYLPDEDARRLATSGTATIGYLGYDWNLNDQRTLGTAASPGRRRR